MLVLHGQNREWKVSALKGNIIEMYHEGKDGKLLLRHYDIVNCTYHIVNSMETYAEGTVYGSTGSKIGDTECGIIRLLFMAKISAPKLVQVLRKYKIRLPENSMVINTWHSGYDIIDVKSGKPSDTWEDVLIGFELDSYNFTGISES